MPYSVQAKNRMLDGTYDVAELSLHSANPGSSGASELTGGSPAYTRMDVVDQDPAATGSKLISDAVDFDVPASTVSFVGQWAGDGVWMGYDTVTTEVFADQGVYHATAVTNDLNVNASA